MGWRDNVRYLGGKAKLGRLLAPIVLDHGDVWWEPFCGGLNMTPWLARARPAGIVSDICLPLISMYRALQNGWLPPENVTREEHKRARHLPDTDPVKAFIGFGCSFSGDWFAGFGGGKRKVNGAQRNASWEEARNSLLRDIEITKRCAFRHLNFLMIGPRPIPGLVIYADPPYVDGAVYKAAPAFDHELFWSKVLQWEYVGVPVLVSEYSCPLPHRILFEKPQSVVAAASKSSTRQVAVERLFRLKL